MQNVTHHLLTKFTYMYFLPSFLPLFIHSFIHPSIHPSIHPFIHLSINPSIHPSIHSFIHPSIHSFVHSFIHSFIHSFTYSSLSCLPQNIESATLVLSSSVGTVPAYPSPISAMDTMTAGINQTKETVVS